MKENLVKSALQLLEARKAALEQINRTSMKAHGKWMNKEFFTWINAHPSQLGNTLLALPAPIVWVVQRTELEKIIRHNPNALENVEQLIIIDIHSMDKKFQHNQLEINSLKGALLKLVELSIDRAIVLITIQGEEGTADLSELDQFLIKIKGK